MVGTFKDKVHRMLGHLIPAFGESVRYEPIDGGRYPILGVFDREFELIDPQTENVIASNRPALGIRLADLPQSPKEGDLVYIDATRECFRVTDSQEDGQGGATLIMHKVENVS